MVSFAVLSLVITAIDKLLPDAQSLTVALLLQAPIVAINVASAIVVGNRGFMGGVRLGVRKSMHNNTTSTIKMQRLLSRMNTQTERCIQRSSIAHSLNITIVIFTVILFWLNIIKLNNETGEKLSP